MKAYLELFRDNKILFIENGCGGNPVASLILREPGASKVVHSSLCLYDEKFNRNFFNISQSQVERAISQEFVETIVERISCNDFPKMHPFSGIKNEVDYIFTSTFVLNSFTEPINTLEDKLKANSVSTHGYINITNTKTNNTWTYHISLHEPNTRYRNIELIAEIGLKLLLDNINTKVSENCYVDAVFINGRKSNALALEYLSKNDKDHVIYFSHSNNKSYRVEDLFRSISEHNNTLTIVKGSFNPLHNGHVEALKITEEYTQSDKAVFAISLSNRDKESKEFDQILQIINNINQNGYDVLLFNKAYYFENNNLLTEKFKTQINYGIGTDIVKRLLDDCNNTEFTKLYNNSIFYYMQRDNHELNDYFDKMKLYGGTNLVHIANNTLPEINSTQIRESINDLLKKVSFDTLRNYINNL